MNAEKQKYLELLSKKYKNTQEVAEEIINLQAILNLPKGTELFLSDIHGEYEAFIHILNNGSGIIKNKIEDNYKNSLPEDERKNLATLIYYPEEKLKSIKKEVKNIEEFYKITLYRLIQVGRAVSSKYTRSKVRKAIPKGFDYIIDELLHIQGDDVNKEEYNKQIIDSIIDLKKADEFIVVMSNFIKRMAIDHLHIIGDIYDRGPGAPIIMDKLMDFHSVDIQWGNHDILWMGAACGNEACITNVVRICSRYDNLATLEEQYGINIRPLSMFATKMYKDDDCTLFYPKNKEYSSRHSNSDKLLMAKIQKAIAIIQFKVEGNLIRKHPEYKMKDRLLLDKINFENGTVHIDGKDYKMKDCNFPSVDPKNPYKLTDEEKEIMERLKISFMNSEKLARHVNFLYSQGGVYENYNNNVLFHGCIPMLENGEFEAVEFMGKKFKGKELMDNIENIAHKAFFGNKEENSEAVDLMWYFWCGAKSPLFGKDKAATFERNLLEEKALHKENKNPYYKLIENEEICDKILENFGANIKEGHIINGHMPVKAKDGESPIRANGKYIVIDGGFSKAYQPTTGIAGYTLSYNSNGLVLAVNEPFESKQKAIEEGSDIKSEIILKEHVEKRKRVADTDNGQKLQNEIADLKQLLAAFREGIIKEKK